MVIPQAMVIQQVMTAGSAFAATNVDDVVILSLVFARLSHWRQALPLLLGKTLGFSLLVLISLLGLLGPQLLLAPWTGLLGLLPIGLGLWRWRQRQAGGTDQASDPSSQQPLAGAAPQRGAPPHPSAQAWAGLLSMAGLTVANGGDNIGVYLPLFAHAGRPQLAVTLLTFALGLALLGLLAWTCSRAPGLAALLGRLGDALVPVLLIGLGMAILLDGLAAQPSELFNLPGLSWPAWGGPGCNGLAPQLPDWRGPR